MKYACFDPASKGIGYSIFEKKESGEIILEEIGFIRPDKIEGDSKKIPNINQLSLMRGLKNKDFQDLKKRLISEGASVIIEYTVRSKDVLTCVKLALMSGALANEFGGMVNLVNSSVWTQKIPKEDRIDFIKSYIGNKELLEIMEKYPKYQQEDIWDSIGIGLYSLQGLDYKKACSYGNKNKNRL